jgi:predicted amidohydrolase YtcJ
MNRSLVRAAEVGGRRVDVALDGDRVVRMAERLEPSAGERLVHANGGALIPGLHDHHIHLLALGAARDSVKVGPPEVTDRTGFFTALANARGQRRDGWIRAIGYHESVAGELDRWVLDEVGSHQPVRVQHRSGAMWVLNSAALDRLGIALDGVTGVERDPSGLPTGRLWRLDGWLREHLPHASLDLEAVSTELLGFGVTGLTDATPTHDRGAIEHLASAAASGRVSQQLLVTGAPALSPAHLPGIEWGPAKVLLPDHQPPDLARMIEEVAAARRQGRAVAVHSVTAQSAAVAVAAIEEVGPVEGDRIEHAAVMPLGLAARLVELGVTVVTNPGFVAERGDEYLAEVDPSEVEDLWRCGSLISAGVSVGAGTDAPFGDPNPWRSIAAAWRRRTRAGRSLGPTEMISPARALDLFLGDPARPGGPPRRVSVGHRGGLCLLPATLGECLAEPELVAPVATMVDGEWVHW